MKIHKSILPIVVGTAVLASPPLSAATSDVVGYTTFTTEAGGSFLVGSPFLKAKSFQGTVSSVDGTTVGLSSDIPELSVASYVHILSGASEGRVSTILSSDVNSDEVVIEDALSISPSDVVAIRPHFTLGDFGELPNFSTVTIFQSSGEELAATYIFGNWDQPASTIIFPGEGVLLNTGEATSVVFTGSVASEPVTVRLAPGVINLVTALRPVDAGSSLAPSGLALFGGLPNFSTISTYEGGSIATSTDYTNAFGWDGNLDEVDISNFKAQVVSPTEEVFVTLPGITL
jgi:hypothetical protein